jgi:H+/Cl- antiporter ClcA
MIKTWTAITSFILCSIVGLVILAPLLPHVATKIGLPLSIVPPFDLYISLIASGLIASIITYIFYRLALKRAKDFLINAEA